MHECSNAQKERKRERKAKQHNTRPETTFSKEKAALRWDSNPHLTHSRHDALPTELYSEAAQLAEFEIIYINQGKAKQSKASIST